MSAQGDDRSHGSEMSHRCSLHWKILALPDELFLAAVGKDCTVERRGRVMTRILSGRVIGNWPAIERLAATRRRDRRGGAIDGKP